MPILFELVYETGSYCICQGSHRSGKIMENLFFLEKSWNLDFLPLSWKSHGFFINHHTLEELLLGCGIVVFPKLAQNFDP